MFSVFINAWKVADIRKKLLYTLVVLLIYRFGAHITLPGIDSAALVQGQSNIYTMLFGSGLTGLSIFAMGIGPYITSSIIMQLLTVAIPKLEQMRKEGEEGQKKINSITRYLTVALALLQSSAMVFSYRNLGYFRTDTQVNSLIIYISSAIFMVCGTVFVMWLAEQITQKGMGNGSSMLILANILSNARSGIAWMSNMIYGQGAMGIAKVVGILVFFVLVIAFVVYVQQGERRLPVQYSQKIQGKRTYGGKSTFIPIKVNIAGVISIIFAMSLLQLPQTIGQFFNYANDGLFSKIISFLNIHHPLGAALYILLIIFFTYFYTSIVFNPVEVAENMKKNGGFIPGIRPGKPTSGYITKIVTRVTFVGAVFYALIALLPILLGWILSESSVGFGGTTILIVVGVALDTVKQIESQLLMRHYKGFLTE